MADQKLNPTVPQVSHLNDPDFINLAGFLGLDKRSRLYKRFKTLTNQFLSAAGSRVKQTAILENVAQRCASLQIHLERLDAEMLSGKPVNSESVSRISNTLAKYLYALDLIELDESPKKPDPRAALARLKSWPKGQEQ
jgi:hypothetical protein